MSIASEIARLQSAKSAIASAINEKGVAVPAATKLDGMAALIGQISGGGGGAQAALMTITITGDDTLVPWSTLQANGLAFTNWQDVFVAAFGRPDGSSSQHCCSIARGIRDTSVFSMRNGIASEFVVGSARLYAATTVNIPSGYQYPCDKLINNDEAEEYITEPYIITDAQGVHLKKTEGTSSWGTSVVLLAIEITGI